MTPTKEIWWNKLITTTSRVKHNCPDIVIWDKKTSVCTIIEMGVPFDTNVAVRQAEKGNKLVSELQQLYPSFKYQIIPVIIGALGAVTSSEIKHQGKQNQNYNQKITEGSYPWLCASNENLHEYVRAKETLDIE